MAFPEAISIVVRSRWLPYEDLRLLIAHPACREVALTVFSNALTLGEFLKFRLETSVSLLPEKGRGSIRFEEPATEISYQY